MGDSVKVTGARRAAFWVSACGVAMTRAHVAAGRQTGANSSDCALIADAGDAIQTVAIGDRVDPANAPRPSNDGERLVFRQIYETLVTADCHGRAMPGLAASCVRGRAFRMAPR